MEKEASSKAVTTGNARVQPRDIAERTFEFAVRIVKLRLYLDERRGVGRVLAPQIVRAGTSVGQWLKKPKRRKAGLISSAK
jgi:hypothetical protein